MANPPLAVVDLAQLAGLEPFPLSLVTDGDRATADFTLDGELWPGGAYAYALNFVAGMEYRFGTSAADDGFAERAMLVDRATGGVVWANALAGQGFGYDGAAAGAIEARSLVLDAPGSYLMVVWAGPDAAGTSPGPGAFHLEARADVLPVVDNPVPPVTDDAVYRFFDPVRQIERLTASTAVRDQLLAEQPQFRFDGVAFVGDDRPRDGWVPVFEVLDVVSGQRRYTIDAAERDALLAASPAAVDQGAAFYVPGAPSENTRPVFHLVDIDTGASFLTSSVNERLYLLLQGDWADEGVAFNAWVPPPPPPVAEPPVLDPVAAPQPEPALAQLVGVAAGASAVSVAG